MKRCGTADLKEGMLVTCPHFENSPRVVVGHVYALAGNRSRVLPTYRVKLVDPKTGIANSFDFSYPHDSFWTVHDQDEPNLPTK